MREREEVLVDRMREAAEAMSAATLDEWPAAFEEFKRCRDEALLSLSRPVRRRRIKKTRRKK